MQAIDAPLLQGGTPHYARSFTGLPDPDAAVRLLGKIDGSPCTFVPVPMDRPLALYGAGDLGQLARKFLTSLGHDFTMVLDRKAAVLAQRSAWSGVQLVHPNEVSEATKHDIRLAISIVAAPYVPIE